MQGRQAAAGSAASDAGERQNDCGNIDRMIAAMGTALAAWDSGQREQADLRRIWDVPDDDLPSHERIRGPDQAAAVPSSAGVEIGCWPCMRRLRRV